MILQAINRQFFFLAATVSIACWFDTLATMAAPSADAPNVVIILVDDMGYGDPQCFNPESKIPTPNIDSLAADGMRFTDAHAPGPLCHMSRYGLMTGRYPFRADVNSWRKKASIAPDRVTIASLLRNVGYQTSMVGKWHLGFDENGYDQPLPGGPVDRGFETYFGIRASTDIPPYFYIRGNKAVEPPTNQIGDRNSEGWTKIQGEFWRAGGIAPNLALKDVLPRFTDEAIAVIDQYSKDKHSQNKHSQTSTSQTSTSQTGVEKPLMMYLAYPAPHTPWLPSSEFNGKSGASMYGDFAMMVDAMIGRVLKKIDDSEMRENTLVIFSSDNGPVWYEEDVKRFGHDSSGGLRGMKSDAWECGHRMPFIVRWPGKVKPKSVSDQMICFTDFLATFADLVDVELPTEAGPDSFSFLKVLTGEQPEEEPIRSNLVVQAGGGTMTIRENQWKLITSLGSSGFSKPKKVKPQPGGPKGQLYNLADDLAETNNLYAKHPDIVKRLSKRLDEIVKNGRSR